MSCKASTGAWYELIPVSVDADKLLQLDVDAQLGALLQVFVFRC